MFLILAVICVLFGKQSCDDQLTADGDRLVVLTVATDVTDGFRRFIRSTKIYDLQVDVLGMHEKGFSGGDHKVNVLKDALKKYKDDNKLIIMYVDSQDVVFTSGGKTILESFHKTNAKVLFSAEDYCRPDNNLVVNCSEFEFGNRFVNPGGFMGYAPVIYEIFNSSGINNLVDDQLFYRKIYLDSALREKWNVKLDNRAEVFQNLNGAASDVELRFSEDDATVHNTAFGTNPLVIHGNGPGKITLNSMSNYLAKSWDTKEGCNFCNENKLSLYSRKVQDMPVVVVAIFIEHPTPFLPEFFERILSLSYPKEKIDLYLHNNVEYHLAGVEDFLAKHQHKFNSTFYVRHDEGITEWHARNMGLEFCLKVNCDYYFSVDSDAQLTNENALRLLIEQNLGVIAPLLVRPEKLWSNFWGALADDGFYARSHDYVELAQRERKGVWNVPFISNCYLIKGSLLKSNENFAFFINGLLDPDMAFCKNLREKNIFIFMTNLDYLGHLIKSETFDPKFFHPELNEIQTNQLDWENRYLHENYSHVFKPGASVEMPCPDVYWFPVVTPIFCNHLIALMEDYGKWSDGSSHDDRLEGGYENVPTRDIHMTQVGLDQQWLYFLAEYIWPVQEKVFVDYSDGPPRALMNFVVRYKLGEQPYLKPHHDSSTYTINIALNTKGKDYEGGGCRFIRYNCSVVDLRQGWSLMHPGKLTHYHEGLQVQGGTRYIMVSFVDP